MDRRAFFGVVVSALAARPAGVKAQTSARAYRLGMLNPGTEPPASDPVLAEWLWAPLREHGYVEGRNHMMGGSARCMRGESAQPAAQLSLF
jgi:hypothetical protein